MKEKILLINPAVNPSSQSKVVNAVITNLLPTSIGVIAGYLEHKGIGPFRIVDEQIDYMSDEALKDIISGAAKDVVVGISVLTISSKRAYDLADRIKEINGNALIVFGGIHPSVLPEESLDRKSVDIVVRGEGEITFSEIVLARSQGKSLSDISGISYREGDKLRHNPDRPLIQDLDEVPIFPYHLFEKNIDRYNSFAAVLTSRGCPYNCSFCSSRNISGKRYRYNSVERAVSEITLLNEKYGQSVIWIIDDNPAANPVRFGKLLDSVIDKGLHKKVEFHGSMRGDNLTEAIVKKLKEANFRMVAFGLETTSERLMKDINKGETVKQVIDAILLADKHGVSTAATLIFGLPGETRQDRRDAIEIIKGLPLSSVRFNTLTPYPGTPVYESLSKAGKIRIKKDWENFAVQYMWESDDIPYVPDGNNRYELLFDTMFANLSFYLSLSGIKRMIRSSFAGGNVISLKGRWYLQPGTVWRLGRLFFYLVFRFADVTIKMLLKRK